MAQVDRPPIRILVVDDEASIRRFADRALRDAGYEVMLASDGPEALRLVEAQRRPFDVFVVDVVMPQMRGDELARQLRQRDPDAKVLYFTGYSDRLFAERKVLWENEAFIEKPVAVKGLLEALSMIAFGHTHGSKGTDHVIRDYYACFNERRIVDARALFAADAVVEMPPFVLNAIGADAYARFADAWLQAFPDAQFTIKHVEQRNETMCEVDLIATGTHAGVLDLGPFGLLKPSSVRLMLRLRELLEFRNGNISGASLTFDLNHLVRELNPIDYRKLTACLASVWELAEDLAKVQGDVERQRDVAERLGRGLDEARHAVRPQFNR